MGNIESALAPDGARSSGAPSSAIWPWRPPGGLASAPATFEPLNLRMDRLVDPARVGADTVVECSVSWAPHGRATRARPPRWGSRTGSVRTW